MERAESYHAPVMVQEVLEYLGPERGGLAAERVSMSNTKFKKS